MRYRAEVDGLRAIAVVPVVLYHVGIAAFAGGYVGVDVFFVISGYLITSILAADLEAGRLSIAAFYERRARRILPALFVVLATAIACAWFLLLPSEMKELGQGITAASVFAANLFLLAKGNDYFGLQSDQNPILHLWSLAVEEQFYLFFPLFLLLVWRFGRKRILYSLLVVSVVSLAWAQYASTRSPATAFYLLPPRAFELLMGAALALLPSTWAAVEERPLLKEVLGGAGLSLIAYAILSFDRRTPFPGAWALLPTAGAALVIAFATGKSLSARLLSSKPLVGVGLISYSLYLWHQPVFAFARVWSYREPSAWTLALMSSLAVGLSYLTWRFVEQPFRGKRHLERRTIFALSLSGLAAYAAFGVVGHFNSGYPGRSELFARLGINCGLSLKCNGNTDVAPDCSTGDRPVIAILGNSYAMHLVDGVRTSFPGEAIVQLTQDSCEPHLGDQPRADVGRQECTAFLGRALSTIRRTPSIQTVFVSSPFRNIALDRNSAAFEKTLEKLRAWDKRVVVVGPTPSNGQDFGKCFVRHQHDGELAACDFDRASVPANHFEVVRRLRQLADRHGAQFVDLTGLVCEETRCHASIGGTLVYRDDGHLSREGSRLAFERVVAKQVATGDAAAQRDPTDGAR